MPDTPTTLCDKCFLNIRPEELPSMYIPKAFCERRVRGYPDKTQCVYYSSDGIHCEESLDG